MRFGFGFGLIVFLVAGCDQSFVLAPGAGAGGASATGSTDATVGTTAPSSSASGGGSATASSSAATSGPGGGGTGGGDDGCKPTQWDAWQGFSEHNPSQNGRWSYGRYNGNDVLFDEYFSPFDNVQGWHTAGMHIPHVARNATGGELVVGDGKVTLPNDTFLLAHPTVSDDAYVTWHAPGAGTYGIEAEWINLHTAGATTTGYVCIDSSDCIYNGPIGGGFADTDSWTGERSLTAGQTVTLYIAADGNAADDSTGLSLHITRICP